MIVFPGLHLFFKINKIAFNIFNIDIYFYAICILLGVMSGIFVCKISKYNYGIKFEDFLEIIFISLFIGIIGARIYYCIFNLEYYLKNPVKIFYLRDGGLAIYGGLISGAIAIFFMCKKKKINILDFFDYIAPSISLAQSIGRWGNFFNQEAYGVESSNILRMAIETVNGYQEVHPTFLYESISTFLIFIILSIMKKNRKFKGQIVYFYLFLYSGVRMLIEGLRIDSLMLKSFRISQILSVVIFVFFSIILLKNYKKYIFSKK